MAGAFAVGGISGGAFNPAVAVGISTMGLIPWSSFWIYLVANLAGGVAASQTFTSLNPEDA
jgi:aquaporin Z